MWHHMRCRGVTPLTLRTCLDTVRITVTRALTHPGCQVTGVRLGQSSQTGGLSSQYTNHFVFDGRKGDNKTNSL